MKRKLLATLLCCSMTAAALVGCGGKASTETAPPASTEADSSKEATPEEAAKAEAPAASDEPVELIFTSVSVTGDSHTTAMTAFAEKVEELSGGSVTCKTYSDGTLLASDAEFDALMNGDIQLAYLSFPILATQQGLEWCSMFASGYFWSSYEHMTNVLNGDIGKNEVFAKVSDKINCMPLSAFYLGCRVVNTRDKEINSYDDMKGLLLRMPNSEAWLNLGEALGANPAPLSFSELYTALQTGTVDAQENPLPTDVSAKFYEVTKYVAITNHVVDSVMPCINKDAWNGMSEAQQTAVTEAMEYARQVNDDARNAEEAKDIKTLEDAGLTITYPDLAEFKENVQAYYKNHPEQTSTWDMALYDKIQAEAK